MNSIKNILTEIWILSNEMAPYLLLGFILAGILSQLISKKIIQKHLCKENKYGSLKGVLFGIPMPICSCGVIPLASSLRNSGASKSSTTSFLTSTPQTGIDSVLITYELLGLVITFFRIITAFLSGLICGFFVGKIDTNNTYEITSDNIENENLDISYKSIIKMLNYGFITLPKNISKPLIIGIILSAIISNYIPNDFFINSSESVISMLYMLFISIPMYICSTASVPIALAFLDKGISSGAVLVFLIMGPATNFANITTLFKIIGNKETIVYLFTLSSCSIISGLLLDIFYDSSDLLINNIHQTHCVDSYFHIISTILLYIILVIGIIPKKNCK